MPTALHLFSKGEITISVESKKQRSYKRRFGNTEFTIVVEESETAKENAYQKVKKLINTNCDKLILEDRRQHINKKTII